LSDPYRGPAEPGADVDARPALAPWRRSERSGAAPAQRDKRRVAVVVPGGGAHGADEPWTLSRPTCGRPWPGPAAVDAGTSERENRARQPTRKETDVSWSLTGSYFETCSCDLMCPCNMSMDHGATYDFCRVTLVFNIKEGEIEGTDVSGLKVAAIVDSPKVMTEGNWRLGLFVDEDATDDQLDKLAAVFGGQKGVPMEAAAPLIGE